MSNEKTLTKAAIIDTLHERLNSEIPKSQISAVIDEQNRMIIDALKDGQSFPMGRLGKFEVAHSAARQGRNPSTGETIQIAASKRIKFKSGQAAKREING